MFEFFLALFGGTYYGSKLANEKHKSKEADKRTQELINDLHRDNERWLRSVVDIKLEYDVNNLPVEEIEKMRMRILNEAKVETVTDDMVFMGLLAQKAKIPKSIAEVGIRSRGVWDYAEQQKWSEQRRFILWYDKELRNNGLQEPMLFVDGVNANNVFHNINAASPVTSTSRMIGGRYFWAPMRVNVR